MLFKGGFWKFACRRVSEVDIMIVEDLERCLVLVDNIDIHTALIDEI